MHRTGIGLACVLLLATTGLASDIVDLQNIDRKIVKEPAYTCRQPLYGLLVVGPAAKPVWLVLDKSKPESEHYDILYADLNGNGDLTESAERFSGKPEGSDRRFHLPTFKDPATEATHTGFTVRVSGDAAPTVMVSMKWRNGSKLGGGYPEDPESGYLRFAKKPGEAPLVWANGDGPFRFQRWYSGKLMIGSSDDFKVFLGQRGLGTNSFCAFQEHVLPDGEGVQATLIYKDARGKEQHILSRLNDRC